MARMHCEKCGEPVHVEKRKMVGLTMTCGCEGNYSIKTAIALPNEWRETGENEQMPIQALRDFIKCQRAPWISRTEDQYHARQTFVAELEEVVEKYE